MNNMVNFYHHGLFMYVNVNYFESYHDVTILRHSNIYQDGATISSMEIITLNMTWAIQIHG
jgi:hypothetical protein